MRIGKVWFAATLVRVVAVAIVLVASVGIHNAAHAQSSVRPPAESGFSDPSVSGNVPGDTLGNTSDSEIWREIKAGSSGDVQVPNPNAGQLIQYEGQLWREIHNGPLPRYGAWALLAVIVLLALAFTFMGRITIENGRSGRTIRRFNGLERAGHWMLASSFILLALTGLNILYGKSIVMPVIGQEAFAALTQWGKYIHNYVAFAFIAGLVLMFVLWVAYNLPNRYDLIWLAKGGGMFSKTHAPAKKFNAGQKILYWAILLGGASLALSGWALLDPFTTHFMTDTFALLKRIGIDVPYWLGLPEPPYSVVTEQQMNQVWHGAMGIFLTAAIIAHIYIGTLGMEGAFEAMTSGDVDENWAREHHPIWVRDLERKKAKESATGDMAQQPAE